MATQATTIHEDGLMPVPPYDDGPAEPELWIKRITYTNIGPFEHFVLEAGAAGAVISGANRLGKTTLIKTFLATHDEHNANLIRQGAEKGEILYEYSDGSSVRHVVTKTGSDRHIKTADGRKVVKQSTAFIKELSTGFAMDPLKLVREKDKNKRKEFLLSVLPIVFARQEIDAAIGESTRLSTEVDLSSFDQFLDGLSEKRKDQKSTVRNLEGILVESERKLPAKDDTDWSDELTRLHSSVSAVREELNDTCRKAELARVQANSATAAEYANDLREIERLRDEEIAAIRRQADEAIATRQKKRDYRLENENDLARRIADAKRNDLQPQIDEMTARLATAQQNAKHQSEMEGWRKQVEQTRATIRQESLKADTYDQQVKGLQAMRKQKLSTLPIKGVEIKDTAILWNGKDFDTMLSTSEQIEVSIKICALAAGRLPVFIIDQAESLDDVRQEEIIEKCVRNGFQVFLTTVVPGKPLTVTPIQPKVAA